jgi:hypothetical protein
MLMLARYVLIRVRRTPARDLWRWITTPRRIFKWVGRIALELGQPQRLILQFSWA